jgi:hypothetical protein
VRLQRAREHIEARLRELALQLEFHQVALGEPPVINQRVANARDPQVREHIDEQLVVVALPEAALVEMREQVDDEIESHVHRAQEQREYEVQRKRLEPLAALVFEQQRGGEDEGREQAPHHHALDGEHDFARREAGDARPHRDEVPGQTIAATAIHATMATPKVVGVRNPRRHGSAAREENFIVGDDCHQR